MSEKIANPGEQELKRQNIGEVLLFHYADFLKRLDTAEELSAQLRSQAEVAKIAFLDTVGEKNLSNLTKPEIQNFECVNSAGLLAARSILFEMLAHKEHTGVGILTPNGIVDHRIGEITVWPLGREVVVQDLHRDESIKEIKNGATTGKFKERVQGKLKYVELTRSGGSMIVEEKHHQYSVDPLVDVENSYSSRWIFHYLGNK